MGDVSSRTYHTAAAVNVVFHIEGVATAENGGGLAA